MSGSVASSWRCVANTNFDRRAASVSTPAATSAVAENDSVPLQSSSPRTSDRSSANRRMSRNSVISTTNDDCPAQRLSLPRIRVKMAVKGTIRQVAAGTGNPHWASKTQIPIAFISDDFPLAFIP